MAGLSFSMHVDNFVKRGKKATEEYTKEFIARIGEKLVDNSPVDTGHYVAMWSLSKDNPFFKAGQYRVGPEDPGRSDTKAELRLYALTVKAGDVVFFTNAARYASYVETGTELTPPHLVVARTRAQSEQIKRSVVYHVSRRM